MNKRAFKILVVTGFALALFCSKSSAQEKEFEMGNKYYEQGQYESAVMMYEKVEEFGIESAALYYNMGNAYFKKGDLGNAILYYHRAKRLAPDDADIANNLDFASKYSTVRMEGVELNPVKAFLQSMVGKYRLQTLGWFASLFFVLFIGLLIVKYGLVIRFTGLNALVNVFLVLVIISSGLTTFKYREDFVTKRAVIVAEDSSVYSGPSTNADLEFEGSPGLVVEIIEQNGDFYNVLFENKRRGWIKKNLVTVI